MSEGYISSLTFDTQSRSLVAAVVTGPFGAAPVDVDSITKAEAFDVLEAVETAVAALPKPGGREREHVVLKAADARAPLSSSAHGALSLEATQTLNASVVPVFYPLLKL